MRPFRFLGVAAAGFVDARQLAGTARRAESIGHVHPCWSAAAGGAP